MARSNTTLLPTAGLEQSPFGILSPATTTTHQSEDYFTSGYTYEVVDAGVKIANGIMFGAAQTPPTTVIDNTDSTERFKTYYPFDIQATIRVSTFGTTPDEIKASALRALDLVTQKAIEIEFWNGNVAQALTLDNDNRYLAGSQTIDLTPTAGTGIKPRFGLAVLEQAIANAPLGAQGTIHVPRDVASALKVKADGKTLRTNLDTPVVAGVGYSRKGPGGTDAPAGHAWMYATGPVTVQLGSVKIVPEKTNQSVNTRINEIEYYVDRPAGVTWSTSDSFAVLIDLSLDYA